MKKIGRCEEIKNLYFCLGIMFFSFAFILLVGYVLRIKDIESQLIHIIYFVLIGVFLILMIPCFLLGLYIFFQPKTILTIDGENKNVFIHYKKKSRKIDISSIENIRIKQGLFFLNHLMYSAIILDIYNQSKPFKIRFAYPPLMIKNELLKLKEKN